jgi:uncharacterized protein YycO
MISPGDILLFYRPRGLAQVISLATRSPFYHVAIGVGDETVIEAIPSGVACRNVNPDGRKRFFKTIAPPEGSRAAALAWAQTQIGNGYDSRDLVGLVLDRMLAHVHVNYVAGDGYTCGEFVALAFERAGARLFPDIDAADVVPADFARFLPAATAVERKARSLH